jgi:spermidine dehydrogenase
MNAHDRRLGMDRSITRRDFLNGVGLGVAGSMLAPELVRAFEQEFAPERAADYYPPTRAGMRGAHAGSFEVAHQLRDRKTWDLSGAVNTGESYDLVIVGGGLSGLSAAYYFIRDVGRNCRVLVLDNHDDFGGHAKRNEFQYGGRMLALNGGTLNIESWHRYNEHATAVMHDIGIDIDRFLASNEKNRGLYRSCGLVNQATFFDKETWGADKLVVRHGSGRGNQYGADDLARTPCRRRRRRTCCGCTAEASGLPPGLIGREEGPARENELPGLPADFVRSTAGSGSSAPGPAASAWAWTVFRRSSPGRMDCLGSQA